MVSYMDMSMLIVAQIRAARYALRWSVQDLSDRSSVSTSTIKRLESGEGVPSISARNLAALQSALETAGIEFIGRPEDAPGIRIRAKG